MFPYPSGDGLHIGHMYNYAVIDSYCRWQRYNEVEVFQPFGYDAFGLPAENYAIKHGRDPKDVTYENINKFAKTMKKMNTQFETKLITSDPSYYKWTQWLFMQLYEKGLAYKKIGIVNWDPIDKTVLANEQVKDGIADRSGAKVEKIEMEQWYFKISAYKDRLLNFENADYPEKTKKQQIHWINDQRFMDDWCVSRQRKWGCPIPIEGETDTLDTFVDSSFYYLRYLTDSNTEFLPKGVYKQVDLYVGGNEHACMHLIYARFIHMFLYDIGIVDKEEPFRRVIHQGMIKMNGEKMSKSKGNVINPDEWDPDEMRFYLMFIGHYFDGGNWTGDGGILGVRRFFSRFEKWTDFNGGTDTIDLYAFRTDIGNYVESFKFNKVVSTFMELYNNNKHKKLDTRTCLELRKILSCFAPGHF